jgi:hypothetical protein
MSASAIIYDADGKILRQVDAHEDALTMQAQAGEFVLFGKADDQMQYIYQGEVADRPIMTVIIDKTMLQADGADMAAFSNVPYGAHIIIRRSDAAAILDAINNSIPIPQAEGVITTGSDTFSTSVAGTYSVTVSLWPYLDWETTIYAA